MAVSEAVLIAITKAVFGYALQQANLSNQVRRALNRESDQLAFRRALGRALEQLQREHSKWTSNLFDASFLEKEGAPVLAQFMIRDGHPDPSELAARWADSLNIRQSEQHTILTRELEPAAANFLDDLAKALKSEPDLRDLNDSRALELVAEDIHAIRSKLDAEQATPGTRRDYLHWLIERNLYLNPRGILQTQRQVQVNLEDVYISLRAQREETLIPIDQRSLEQQLTELEAKAAHSGLTAEEIEDQREQILSRVKSYEQKSGNRIPGEVSELAEAVGRHDRLVILGDPGSGKSTLVRYLALKHAQAIYDGRKDAEDELGQARFPILVRVADYAENGIWKEKSLTDFLAEACTVQECPGRSLADLFETELADGNCLILLDGLDEIVSADDRRGVVRRIENFVHRYSENANRFVVTSRIAGYRNAPLSGPFTHYTVQEMDDSQIRRFLELWCPAVEVAQTPDLSREIRDAKAQQEIDSILEAVQTASGVRALAANPLLLTTLALIHRTGSRLPQKRIELYKIAADTLARTWRLAAGVPESALVEEEYLTRLLGRFAYWLHEAKDTGIATQREVYDVLGKEWARINGLDWDPDEPNPKIVEQVRRLLERVHVHTGLFVERAPGRYGFMHLTFEEYYAARNLVARPRLAPQTIRKHLHDPRWEEPILLALGFVGLDYQDQAIELVETAIRAQGEEAEELQLVPSPYEDLLGRDFLFTLRCLGDRIPVDPIAQKQLLRRLAGELLEQTGSAKFQRYRQTLDARLEHLGRSLIVNELVAVLQEGLSADDKLVRYRAAATLGRMGPDSAAVVEALKRALIDGDEQVRYQSAISLTVLARQSPQAVEALREALDSDDGRVRVAAAASLVRMDLQSPQAVEALREALSDEDKRVRYEAVTILARLEPDSIEVVEGLKSLLLDGNGLLVLRAVDNLARIGRHSSQAVEALREALNSGEKFVRYRVVRSLGRLEKPYSQAIELLKDALASNDNMVRYQAINELAMIGRRRPEVVEVLREMMRTGNNEVVIEVAESLGRLGLEWEEAAEWLREALDSDDGRVRVAAAASLVRMDLQSPQAVEALREALSDEDEDVRYRAIGSLGEFAPQQFPPAIEALKEVFGSRDNAMRYRAAITLAQLGLASTELFQVLREAIGAGDKEVRYRAVRAVDIIAQKDLQSPQTVEALREALSDEDEDVRYAAVTTLAKLDPASIELRDFLLEGVQHADDETTRAQFADILRRTSEPDGRTFNTLLMGLTDEDDWVRTACAQALAGLAQRHSESADEIAKMLIQAIRDPRFAQEDKYTRRTGHDYAFDALWMLVTPEEIEET